MTRHKVELAAPAERTYNNLRALSAGERSGRERELLRSIDEIINEEIPNKPFSGRKLYGLLAGISVEGLYWISRETLHVFYEASVKPLTIVIDFIWTGGPNTEANIQQADLLFAQMLLSGQVVAVPGLRLTAN